jgi:hypothetical protein
MSRLLLLLLPSLSSSIFTLLITIAILGTSAWSYIEDNQLFYEFIFGIYGLKTTLQSIESTASIQYAILNGPYTYFILLIMSALIIGGMVYVVLESLKRAAEIASEEMQAVNNRALRKQVAREALMKLVLRVVAALGWALYIVLFVSVVIPTAILLTELALQAFEVSLGTAGLYGAGAAALLLAALHVHIIFARLCMLRPRLFGDSEIEEAEHHQW